MFCTHYNQSPSSFRPILTSPSFVLNSTRFPCSDCRFLFTINDDECVRAVQVLQERRRVQDSGLSDQVDGLRHPGQTTARRIRTDHVSIFCYFVFDCTYCAQCSILLFCTRKADDFQPNFSIVLDVACVFIDYCAVEIHKWCAAG